MKLFIILFMIAFMESALANDPPIAGWRYPTEADMTGDWKNFRGSIPEPYHVKADFNGDGAADDAWILIKEKKKGWGLFVFLKQKTDKYKIIKLDEEKGSMHPQRMGIILISPSKEQYKTACGKGYWECKPGEPELLQITLPSINYFMYESADSIYTWNKSTKSFKRIWMSD